jgi:hypothetical protein
MEHLDFLIGTSSLPLASQRHFVLYHLDLEKYFKGIPKNYVSLLRVEDNLVMKTNSIDKKIK